MRLNLEQLSGALQSALRPVYLISGDEPLQLGEAADLIRAAARQAEFGNREVISVDRVEDWPMLVEESEAVSIFADKKLIDLRLSCKPGNEGSKVLLQYCQHLPVDTVLLITTGKIDSAAQKSQWFQAIERVGVIVQIWPLQGQDLIKWLQRRAAGKGMTLTDTAASALARRIEGNLLAAAQEIEKLFILYGPTKISGSMIEDVVADSARFDVFKLSDAVLAGQVKRVVKILNALKAEGVAAPVVLWLLSREARTLLSIKCELQQGGHRDSVFKHHKIWDKRIALTQEALARLNVAQMQTILQACAAADSQIKGQTTGDGWERLFEIALKFCLPNFADIFSQSSPNG